MEPVAISLTREGSASIIRCLVFNSAMSFFKFHRRLFYPQLPQYPIIDDPLGALRQFHFVPRPARNQMDHRMRSRRLGADAETAIRHQASTHARPITAPRFPQRPHRQSLVLL